MLTTSKKPQFSYLRRLMVLPLVAALICLFAFTIKTSNPLNVSSPVVSSKPFVLVVDAGHGGKDNGAVGNGLNEKDVALKIAQKIKDISSQYDIDVVLTRNSDVYMDVKEKSDFANRQNANAFISLHANADKDNPAGSGFEVALSQDNEKFATQNQALGSAILQALSKDFTAAADLKTRNVGIWILKNSNKPSALIECGYITNATDAGNLKDDAKLELMAKNILQGIALYANGINDKSTTYQTQNGQQGDTIPAVQPLYIVDGKIASKEEVDKLDNNLIESINVWKDKSATDKYGDKGKNGVVEITMKKAGKASTPPANALYVVDEKIVSKEVVDKLDPNSIASVTVWKDKSATDKYGDKGKNGVVEVVSKKTISSGSHITNEEPVYVLNGKVISHEEFKKIDPDNIKSLTVLKDKQATDKYGEQAKYGAIEITTKSAVDKKGDS